jgi:hypothetical protein
MGGSNDIFYSGTDSCATEQYRRPLLEQLDAGGARPIVGIPLPVVHGAGPGRVAPVVDAARYAALELQYADLLRKYCGFSAFPQWILPRTFSTGRRGHPFSLSGRIHPTGGTPADGPALSPAVGGPERA